MLSGVIVRNPTAQPTSPRRTGEDIWVTGGQTKIMVGHLARDRMDGSDARKWFSLTLRLVLR
jgi:hypothetical protein